MRTPTKVSVLGIATIEIFLAMLMGGVPIWIAYGFGGMQGLEHELSGLIASRIVIWWSAAMSVVGFLLLALNKWKLKLSDLEESIWRKVNPISVEFVSVTVGMLRVIAGLLIGFVLLWTI